MDKNACLSERVYKRSRIRKESEREQRRREEKHSERQRDREGALCSGKAGEGASRDSPGKRRCVLYLLIGDSNWLQIGFSRTEDSPACGVRSTVHRKEGNRHLLLLPLYPTCLTDGTGRMIFDSHPATSPCSPH